MSKVQMIKNASPFERGACVETDTPATAAAAAAVSSLPNFVDTAAKVAAAKAALDAATAKREEAAQAARDARAKAHAVLSKIDAETQSLATAQEALGAALMAGTPIEKLQALVNGLRLNVESLKDLHRRLNAQADAADADLPRGYAPIAEAQQRLDLAEFDHLLAQYAKLIAPAISMAAEIRLRSHRMSISMELSGLLLDPRRAQIGPYSVDAAGNLFMSLR
jgi:chromosome segregation ATPase